MSAVRLLPRAKYKTMKLGKNITRLLIFVMLMGMTATLNAADPVVRQAPPRKPNKHRVFHDVPVADLVENSPEWVFWKLMLASKKMDFEELAKYQSPAGVWAAKQNTPETMAAFTSMNFEGSLRIDDSIYDGDACCIYMGFQGRGGATWQTAYRYFLKKDGKWLAVSLGEWKRGKFDAVPRL